MRSKIFTVILFLLCCCFVQAQDTSKEAVAFADLSLDKLMDVQVQHVVTATGYLQTTDEAPSTITVITAQQIADRGYEQLEDALRDVPGIDMIHVNGYAPTLFYFRGMYGAENLRALFMIDGIAENNILGSNDMAGPAYSLQNVQRIEIIWGPASALYGANAFGGIINIITKKGGDIHGVHAEAGGATFNTTFYKISAGEKKARYEYSIAGTMYNTDGPVFSNRDPQYHASFVDHAHSFNGTLSYFSRNSKTSIGYREYVTPMGWGTYSNSPTLYLGLPDQGNGNTDTTGILARNFNGQKPGVEESYLRTGFMQEEYKASRHLDLLGRLVYRETGTAADSYLYITVNSPLLHDGNELLRENVTSFSDRIAGELSANFSPFIQHHFTLGADFYRDNVEQGARRTTLDLNDVRVFNGKDTVVNYNTSFLPRLDDIRYNIGSFLQYIYNANFLGKTTLTLGGRDDYNSYFGNTFSPRVVVVNQPNDVFTFKFQYGKAFRAPSNLEIHQASLNFTLNTEKIRTFEVDGIYSSPSKKIRLQLNLFDNYLTDVIVLSNLSGLTVNKNPGRIIVNGLEFSSDISLSKTFSGFVNLTWQDTKGENLITGVNRFVSGVARIKGNAGITLHMPDDPFSMSLSGNYVGQREVPLTDPYGPVAGYFLTNWTLNSGKIRNTCVSFTFEVRNIFNVTWLDPGFRTADGNIYSTVLEQPGRTFLFKANIDL
jgi:outer membrane receptor for ferrienterochelin and colicins